MRVTDALAGHVIAPLGLVPTVSLVGPDARRFANGMFTNNVRDLPVGGSQRTAMTDDRGRLWALAELHAMADERFVLHLDGQSEAAFADRYDTYVVFDDVTIEQSTVPAVSVQGARAAEVLRAHGLPTPAPGRHQGDGPLLVVARDRCGVGGFDVYGPWEVEPTADGAAILAALELGAGQVRMTDVVPPGLPHEHGLREAVLHFEKGCYLGQEAIHRLDVQGNPRRGLAVVVGEGLEPGPLLADGKEQGRVTRVAVGEDDVPVGVAVLRKPYDQVGSELVHGPHTVRVVAPRG